MRVCVCVLSVCSIHWSLHMVQEYAANHTLKFNEKFANFEQHRAPECGAIWILLCTWIDSNLWTELVSNYTLDLILMNSYVKNKHNTKITSQMMNSEKPNNIRWLVESLFNIPFSSETVILRCVCISWHEIDIHVYRAASSWFWRKKLFHIHIISIV